MAARILSCLIVLTFLLSSTGPLWAAQPPQQPPISPAAVVPAQAAVSQALRANLVMFIENAGQFAAGAPNAEIAAVLASATQVAAGGYHTCALTTGGGVKCWGENRFGQLGVNPGWTPVNVVGFEGVVVYDLTIVAAGQGAVLTWTHLGQVVARYEVYRSATPYFAPGDPGAQKLDDVPPPASGATVSYTDPAAFAAPPAAYFYLVLSVDGAGLTYPATNRVGACCPRSCYPLRA